MKTSFHFTNINLRYELEFENNNGHSLFCLHIHCIQVCYHMVGGFFLLYFLKLHSSNTFIFLQTIAQIEKLRLTYRTISGFKLKVNVRKE